MPLLQDIRRFFSGKKKEPVDIDLTGTQAEGLADAGKTSDRNSGAERAEAESGGENPLVRLSHRSSRAKTVSDLQRGYDEVLGLVQKIGDHLDAQSDRTERMMNVMERLPQAIDALPEINRQNARLLDILSDHLSQAKDREQAMNNSLRRLGDSADHHTEVLSVLQQQLDANHRASEQMTETLGSFREALTSLAQTNNRSTDILSRISAAGDERESKLTAMFQQTQRWMIAVGGAVGALALIAVILAILAIQQ